ncbi:MAG: XdhC/CoxI family protein [Ignavibacteria bacterium]|jgi:xanthine dehydrogenase accessory factor|nr:XdhC/CoxI family protein [Ignavibacteria bacterium]MDH7526887.1 XdhC/CoxI family protein [Ignavibacteria bacterium]
MNIFEKISELVKQNKPFVLTTIVKTEGSTPGKLGFRMIVEDENKTFGTVGGGEIEREVIFEAMRRMKSRENGVVEYLLSADAIKEKEEAKVLSMSCSGRCWILYEVFGVKPVVYVFGGGHVGQALLKQLSLLNFHKILIDNRPEFANKETNPYADEIILSDYSEYAYKFNPPEDAFIVIMTHGHSHDFDVIEQIYARNLKVRYIGVIASKTKAQKLKNQIKEIFGEVDLSNLHSPIGLDIGGETPQEIALSIAAEMQKILYEKKAEV